MLGICSFCLPETKEIKYRSAGIFDFIDDDASDVFYDFFYGVEKTVFCLRSRSLRYVFLCCIFSQRNLLVFWQCIDDC